MTHQTSRSCKLGARGGAPVRGIDEQGSPEERAALFDLSCDREYETACTEYETARRENCREESVAMFVTSRSCVP